MSEEYKLVKGVDIDYVENTVNAAIAEGWNTVGELKVLVIDNRHNVLVQQMRRERAVTAAQFFDKKVLA
jgi:hypothetical protein